MRQDEGQRLGAVGDQQHGVRRAFDEHLAGVAERDVAAARPRRPRWSATACGRLGVGVGTDVDVEQVAPSTRQRAAEQVSCPVRPTAGAAAPIVVRTETESRGLEQGAEVAAREQPRAVVREPPLVDRPPPPTAAAAVGTAGNVGTGRAPGSPAALPHEVSTEHAPAPRRLRPPTHTASQDPTAADHRVTGPTSVSPPAPEPAPGRGTHPCTPPKVGRP